MSSISNDIYDVWNGEKAVFTLDKIFKIIGIPIPYQYLNVKDVEIKELNCNEFSTPNFNGNELYVLFDVWPSIKNKQRFVNYAERGAIIFSPVNYLGRDNLPIPRIYVESGIQAWYKIGRYIKNLFDMPTVGITGTVGKTTTTLFAQYVFSEKYNVFTSGNNRNTAVEITKQLILRYSPEYNFHIQETGGGRSRLVEESVKLIQPDAFCITKINKYHHIDNYESPEEIVYDKTSYDRYSKENTFGVINIDDDELRNHEFDSKMITCGVNSADAQYTAKDIKQKGMYLSFTVCGNGEEVPIKIKIVGTHNVYNALLVFALAKQYGLTNEEIQSGFLKYESKGIRQNIKDICGRIMYIDCFNVCADSIKSCNETLASIEISPENRKIAVYGGENALGKKIYSINYETGCGIKEYDIDEFIFTGPKEPATEEELNYYGNGRAVYEGAKTVIKKSKISFTDDMFALAKKLKEETKPGDLILFKGIFRVPLFAAIDIAFGTSFLVYNPNFKKIPVRNAIKGFTGRYASQIGGVNIHNGTVVDGVLTIPDTIHDFDVFRIGRRVFAERDDINSIDFGPTLKNIGSEAFESCVNIKELVIPENVVYIEEHAFANCTNLQSVVFEGVGHIETGAFSNCKELKTVKFIGNSCKTIEPGAFEGCSEELTIYADENTVAEKYAEENAIAYKNNH